ncbi:MAG TPA: nucleotide exchange factor GrpE [Kofleriaceae bacterium]|nr:nucleotide exchange factor GrpE [Kofleriaceae bacterium]
MSTETPTGEPASAPADATTSASANGGDDIKVEVVPTEQDPAKAIEEKLAALEKEKKEYWDRYLRAAADLENVRKRQKREVEDAKLESKNKTLKEMLPVVDNLERAIEHAAQAGSNPIVEGVQLVLRQFTTAFERLEVTAIDAQGQPFDPNLHEAISQQESDQPAGTVVQVLQRGYRSGERLLRPALVVVAKAAASKAD